ncbi:hypothetical protein ACJRO7_006393 [Eucalyptus globulus]|uniref:Wall-associated receptor kinase galacturonan-binding domain-containing protein n=1 Tax=Eucalyptus globulus TaxID=34317 RepID=A0ABD3IJ77_EUCGL
MLKNRVFVIYLLLLLLLLLHQSFSITIEKNECTNSCGEISNITYPFQMKGDPKGCGDHHFELACINNHTVLNLYPGKYYVRYISYTNYTIRIADVGLQNGNCSSFPHRSLSCAPSSHEWKRYTCLSQPDGGYRSYTTVTIFDCTKAIDSPLYVDTSLCFDGVELSNFSSTRGRVYAMIDADVSSVETACTIKHMAMIPWWVNRYDLLSYAQIHEQMSYGFELSWLQKACKTQFKGCWECSIDATSQIYCSDSKYLRFVQFSQQIYLAVKFHLNVKLSSVICISFHSSCDLKMAIKIK